MNDKAKPKWGGSISGITKVGANLSVIIGIVIGLVQIVSLSTSAKSTLNGVQLQSLEHIEKILNEDQRIRKYQRKFFYPNEDYEKARDINKLVDSAKKQIEAGIYGEEVFYSEEFEAFRYIYLHYKKLGSIISLGYLDFDIIFQNITFPKRFWEQTGVLRDVIGSNWNGCNDGIKDFGDSFMYLCLSYQTAREKLEKGYGKSLNCEKKVAERLVCKTATPIHSDI